MRFTTRAVACARSLAACCCKSVAGVPPGLQLCASLCCDEGLSVHGTARPVSIVAQPRPVTTACTLLRRRMCCFACHTPLEFRAWFSLYAGCAACCRSMARHARRPSLWFVWARKLFCFPPIHPLAWRSTARLNVSPTHYWCTHTCHVWLYAALLCRHCGDGEARGQAHHACQPPATVNACPFQFLVNECCCALCGVTAGVRRCGSLWYWRLLLWFMGW